VLAFEADALGSAYRDSQHRSVGTHGQILADRSIQVVLDPVASMATVFGIDLQGRLREAIGRPG
jgi:hypothetical protein